MTRFSLLIASAILLAACSGKKEGRLFTSTSPDAPTTVPAAAPVEASPLEGVSELPAGAYKVDPAHASLIFRVDHLGFSNYSASFAKFDAQLQLDPAHPDQARLTATVDANSIELPSPPPGFTDDIKGPKFLDVKKFPRMTFKSTKVEMSGVREAHVTGDFTMHGVTRPITLDIIYNGGWPGVPQDPRARVGFSAHGALKRSDFGIDYGIPASGSKMGVGDRVDIIIEAEFLGPERKVLFAPVDAPGE